MYLDSLRARPRLRHSLGTVLMANPFIIGVVVRGPAFTDRAAETAAVVVALREPGARLLVTGERRMGKTSVLRRAAEGATRRGGGAALVDCGTAGTPVEVANRVLTQAARAIGRDWGRAVSDLGRTLSLRLQVGTDPQTQLPTVSLEPSAAAIPRAEQPRMLEDVLRALDARAARLRRPFGILLDEVQRLIVALGADASRESDALVAGEWRLRGILQELPHLSVVLAGSEPTLFAAMQTHGRAFYQQFTPLHIGPIAAEHFSRWIDARASGAGLKITGIGAPCLELAGPRTRDVVQLARAAFSRGVEDRRPKRGRARGEGHSLVATAYADVVASQADPFRGTWESLAGGQQQVLRAVAAADAGMTTGATRVRFGLGASGPVIKALAALADQRLIARDQSAGPDWTFDNPFFRGWVVANALPDIGMFLPITHRRGA